MEHHDIPMASSPGEASRVEALGQGLAEMYPIPLTAGDVSTPHKHQATMRMTNGQRTIPKRSLIGAFSPHPARYKPENDARTTIAAGFACALCFLGSAQQDRLAGEQS